MKPIKIYSANIDFNENMILKCRGKRGNYSEILSIIVIVIYFYWNPQLILNYV